MTNTDSALDAQKQYVKELEKSNFKFGLTVGAAFVRGIRDIGYKHSGTALAELIDNGYQAGGEHVHVVFGYEGAKSAKKPAQIAVIDDGHGMVPQMIRIAAMWGGTHRENDRSGFGRYGYGLPSASISQGQRFTIYSKVDSGDVHAVSIDIDDIANGKYTNENGDIIVPKPEKAELPAFVKKHLKDQFPNGAKWEHGTVVVIDRLDRLTWKTSGALQENLLRHFGVTYHKLRHALDIWVNDKRVEPIDPLFLTPGYRWYDLDADRAQAMDPMRIEVKDPETRESIGHIEVRFSYMPPTFASKDKGKKAQGSNANERMNILRDYNGFIFSRMGRIIDVVSNSPLTTFVNNDRYIKVEIDFPAALDEEFNISTSKQRVDVSDRIWEILKNNGLVTALTQLRKKFREEKSVLADVQDNKPDEARRSEEAMQKASEVARQPSPETKAKREHYGKTRLRQEAEKRAAQTGRSVDEVEQQLLLELEGHPYKVSTESMPGAPFFRVDQWGGTKMLFMNTASRFYQDVYAGPNSSPAVRDALEVLLFSIGDCRLEASDQVKAVYDCEIPEWSKKLEYALFQLSQNVSSKGDDEDDEELDEARDAVQAAE